MSAPIPSFYDDIDATLAHALGLLVRGVPDRRSPFHHPVVATLGVDGRPRLRTVILRGFDFTKRELRFHTDRRSQKVSEIAADPRVSLIGYDSGAKIQLRIEGIATLHTYDAVADAAWEAAKLFSRQCYGIAPGPGTPLDASADFALPETTEEGTAPGRAHFTAVTVRMESLEWLYLASQGHRRALYSWDTAGALSSSWLAP
jgi:pyridoxamine 5'-phosphate oxidase